MLPWKHRAGGPAQPVVRTSSATRDAIPRSADWFDDSLIRHSLVRGLSRPRTRPEAFRLRLVPRCYLISTLAPASSSFFFAASASALFTPSLTGLGAPSTRSLASFRPRLVSSRTALITLTL